MDSTSTAASVATSTSEVPVTSPFPVASLDGRGLSPARLMGAPLPQLLTEADAVIYDSSITDEPFFGAAIQRKDGHIALAMPPGRDAIERDSVARMLLGKMLHVELAPLPRTVKLSASA